MNENQFPIYIPSKGRYQKKLTSDALSAMCVYHNIVVEPQEFDLYRRFTSHNKFVNLVQLDMSYKEKYDTLDKLGTTISTGSGPTRNFIWDHSIQSGYNWHWIMDDNLDGFTRLVNNQKIRVNSPAIFKAMEDFVLRYENVGMAGPNYDFFAKRKQKIPPFIINTKLYSCNLIRNDLPFRWRGRYNEDVILSLDMLKAGWCTIQFNAFLQNKARTQTMKGGNTSELYSKYGTLPKSQMLVKAHPDVAEVVWKFGRWHHHVDYSDFKYLKLKRRSDYIASTENNEYNMKLAERV